MDEEKYKEDLKAAGVDLPELDEAEIPEDKNKKEPAKEPEKPEKPAEPEKKPEDSKDKPEDKKPDLQTKKPEEPKKPRSIYEEYKDKKSEAKSEKERADTAEAQVVELQRQITELTTKAKDGDKPTEAEEAELIKYAEENGQDVDLVKRILKTARKGIASPDYETIKKDIDELKNTTKGVTEKEQKLAEQQHFDTEFATILPSIKESFPNATEEELGTIKKELDKISHSQGWNDKDLDYIVFKNKETLSALVTPKKRGMESRERKDVITENTYEFDPNPDFSKMTQKERDEWESQYRQAGKSDGLLEGAGGKKIIL